MRLLLVFFENFEKNFATIGNLPEIVNLGKRCCRLWEGKQIDNTTMDIDQADASMRRCVNLVDVG